LINKNVVDKINHIFNDLFDSKQRNAVDGILEQWNSGDDFVFPIIDGPPGTGKSTVGTVAAAKYLLENSDNKITYLCFTNFATDWAWNMLQSYGLTSKYVIRLHHNPRLTDLSKGIIGCKSDLSDQSRREKENIKNCGILLCTLHGSSRSFNVQNKPKIIIDEFSQVSPPMFFSVLYKAYNTNPNGYALLGDPIQLPVISTQPMLTPNIGVYIMQRKIYDPHQLTLQHRMHEKICDAINSIRQREFNTYKLETAKDVRDRDLSQLGYNWDKNKTPIDLQEILDPAYPVVLVNTDSCGVEKKVLNSTFNGGEAQFALRLAKAVNNSFKDHNGIKLMPMMLSPYAAQIGELRQLSPPDLQWYDSQQPSCTTIYRSQGREYPCVIISMVRNNPGGYIGFLDRFELKAQTYVACSRAKAKLIVLFSFSTFLDHDHRNFEALYSTDVLKVDAKGRAP
jgi:superfamily I DNA and/or RNA helicase